mmetsp:Transcript_58576/g.68428  ORF Transcript_58576/g.68428 Transcript_58576/m.68428 type:complete len:83 (-) Transcript_58576:809-1057(-)
MNNSTISNGSKNKHVWDRNYQDLKAYHTKFGDCLVPSVFLLNPKLGRWVNNLRGQYKRYQKKEVLLQLNPRQIELLNEIGFV